MVTDPAEVRRLGESKAAENLAFRRRLTSRDAQPFQILATEVAARTDCTACANCCRELTVTVGPAEIEAIARHLNSTPAKVAREYTVPDPLAPSELLLRHTAQGCVFLDGNLCMIYDARPPTCRDFPHIAPGSHTLGGRFSTLFRNVPVCPILYNAVEAYKHRTGFPPTALP
ncbi:MAG: YkgJ family cysteine cluster protein [Bryobacteraceae bacterium]